MRLNLSPLGRSFVRGCWIVVVGGFWFVLLPALAESLNEQLGWPRWEFQSFRVAGALLLGAGIALLLWCSRLFSRIGKGSIVPIDEPVHLVAVGPYRYSRNPIYVAYVVILMALFLLNGHLALVIYAALFSLFLHSLTVFWEEPHLHNEFGTRWEEYRKRVPRWLSFRPGARGRRPTRRCS